MDNDSVTHVCKAGIEHFIQSRNTIFTANMLKIMGSFLKFCKGKKHQYNT